MQGGTPPPWIIQMGVLTYPHPKVDFFLSITYTSVRLVNSKASGGNRITNQEEIMSEAFFYVGAVPTRGCWVDLASVDSWDEISAELSKAGYSGIDEILCADAEDLALHFLSRYDSFDLAGYINCRDSCIWATDEAKAAFMDCFGSWDASEFEDSYSGEWESDMALAEDFIESTGMLADVPDTLQRYFDTEAFTRDLMMDYSTSSGYYFRNY